MILSDNETKIDLLNNQAIAKTIVSIIKESKEAVSIGVHGDWGAGKSSILAMVEDEVKAVVKAEKEKSQDRPFKAATIRFNGWQHQGFEDSKVALMSAIVSQLGELAKKHPITGAEHKVKETIKNLWKNINWLHVAKQAGTIGFSLATGTAPLTILTNVFDSLKGHMDSEEHVKEAVGTIGEYIQKASVSEDTSSLKEFNEFKKNFKELLQLADINKLIVIIDDLDRCLPTVAIETLEAVRLFMFMEETAFVIGADEIMIRYAVKKHFPDMEREKGVNIGDDFADKYLEKLIQIPFRIPALGSVESQLYTALLLSGSKLDAEKDDGYKKLIEAARKKLEKPWDITPFALTDVSGLLGDMEYEKVQNEIIIALQISPILSGFSRGNPRVIKRFVNMLLLRYEIAKNRGYGKDINLQILAKMMLAERKWPKLYENIAYHLVEGKSPELGFLEDEYGKAAHETGEKQKKSSARKNKDEHSLAPSIDVQCAESDEYKDWIVSEPKLKDVDLRPYYAASKEKKDYFIGPDTDDILRDIVSVLMKDDDFLIAEREEDIKGLSEENAAKAFDIVVNNIILGDMAKAPAGFLGLKKIVELHQSLRKSLVDYVSALPADKVDIWVLTGWEKAIPTGSAEHDQLESYFDRINEQGQPHVKQALKTRRV